MEILIGEPIILIYESGVCTSNDPDYYLGRHVYGCYSHEGPIIAGGLIDSAKYVVPFKYWNYGYMLRDNNGKIDRMRFLGGYAYDDFLVDKVVDIENEELQNICWWKEKTEPSIKHILEFYAEHKLWDKFVDVSKYMK